IFQVRMGGTTEAPLDYTTYLLSGLIPWLTFADIANRACSSITANAGLVKQVLFPVEILPIKTVAAALVSQLVATVGLLVYVLVMLFNPFTYVAWVYQDAVYYGRFLHPFAWIVFTVLNLAFLSLGFRLFRVLRPSFGDFL